MVLDTSALMAVLFDEPERRRFNELIAAAPVCRLSTATFVEASIVVETRLGETGGRELDLFVHRARIELTPVDADQAEIARAAHRRHGKGRGPAGLNFGDCFSYALSMATGEPLLFKGDDFSKTDIESAA